MVRIVLGVIAGCIAWAIAWVASEKIRARAKRDAQQRIVEMMLPQEGMTSDIRLQRRQPNDLLGDGD